MPADIERIMEIYEVDLSWTDLMSRTRLRIKLERWRAKSDDLLQVTPMVIRIQKKRKAFMEERVLVGVFFFF